MSASIRNVEVNEELYLEDCINKQMFSMNIVIFEFFKSFPYF